MEGLSASPFITCASVVHRSTACHPPGPGRRGGWSRTGTMFVCCKRARMRDSDLDARRHLEDHLAVRQVRLSRQEYAAERPLPQLGQEAEPHQLGAELEARHVRRGGDSAAPPDRRRRATSGGPPPRPMTGVHDMRVHPGTQPPRRGRQDLRAPRRAHVGRLRPRVDPGAAPAAPGGGPPDVARRRLSGGGRGVSAPGERDGPPARRRAGGVPPPGRVGQGASAAYSWRDRRTCRTARWSSRCRRASRSSRASSPLAAHEHRPRLLHPPRRPGPGGVHAVLRCHDAGARDEGLATAPPCRSPATPSSPPSNARVAPLANAGVGRPAEKSAPPPRKWGCRHRRAERADGDPPGAELRRCHPVDRGAAGGRAGARARARHPAPRPEAGQRVLTDEGQPMLLDFNLAQDVRQGATAAQVGGTLHLWPRAAGRPRPRRAAARPLRRRLLARRDPLRAAHRPGIRSRTTPAR